MVFTVTQTLFLRQSLFRSLPDNFIENGKIARLVVNREVGVVAVDLHRTHTHSIYIWSE